MFRVATTLNARNVDIFVISAFDKIYYTLQIEEERERDWNVGDQHVSC
jgi:hypothetical protein